MRIGLITNKLFKIFRENNLIENAENRKAKLKKGKDYVCYVVDTKRVSIIRYLGELPDIVSQERNWLYFSGKNSGYGEVLVVEKEVLMERGLYNEDVISNYDLIGFEFFKLDFQDAVDNREKFDEGWGLVIRKLKEMLDEKEKDCEVGNRNENRAD